MRQENEDMRHLIQAPLSEVWLELLGGSFADATGEIVIPALESDPWSELLQDRRNEVVDLQELHLHVSDQDVEQVLQIMHEENEQDTDNRRGIDT